MFEFLRTQSTTRRPASTGRRFCFPQRSSAVPERVETQIDVGILGATGHGRPAVHRAARRSPLVPADLAGRQRAVRGARVRRGGGVASGRQPPPASIAAQRVEACTPGRGPRLMFSALDATAAVTSSRHSRAPGTSSSATRATTAWIRSVPLLIPEINPDHLALPHPPAPRPRLAGRHRHQPELLDHRAGDGARAAAPVRAARRQRHDAAGGVGRGLPGRGVARHPRQRRSRSSPAKKRRWRARRRRSSARSSEADACVAAPGRRSAPTRRACR